MEAEGNGRRQKVLPNLISADVPAVRSGTSLHPTTCGERMHVGPTGCR